MKIVNVQENIFSVSSEQNKSTLVEYINGLHIYRNEVAIDWNLRNTSSKIFELRNNLLKSLKKTYENKCSDNSYFPNFFSEKYRNKSFSSEFYEKKTKSIQQSLQNVPVYVILNGEGRIVLANSKKQNQTSLKNIGQYPNNVDDQTEKNPRLGLFFMSYNDAKLYLKEIAKTDTEGTKKYGLSISCFGLDFAYRVIREYHPGIDFRIIPDLDEMQKLLINYIGSPDMVIENEQKWFPVYQSLSSNQSFKGTPIYIVQVKDIQKNLLFGRHTDSKNLIKIINFRYKQIIRNLTTLYGNRSIPIMHGRLKNKVKKDTVAYIFFEKETAVNFVKKVGTKVCSQPGTGLSKINSLINKPELFVYNLEDFLELWEESLIEKGELMINMDTVSAESSIFDPYAVCMIPSKSSIENLFDYLTKPEEKLIKKSTKYIKFKIRYINRLIKELLNHN